MNNYKNGDGITIEGTRYIIAKTMDDDFVLINAKDFVPSDWEPDPHIKAAEKLIKTIEKAAEFGETFEPKP